MPFPLATLAATVDANGITAPPYSDILQSLQASFQSIYGSDAYIEPDSQDGQLLAVFAKAISDSNDVAIAVYNSFSPATSTGRALSNNVKLNGISRAIASRGSVLQRVVGVIGTTIMNGIVADAQGNRWLLPAAVTIPGAGQVDVTATAEKDGAITAGIGTLTTIANPQQGWQTTTNISAAAPGAPVESDATLRRRQTFSTALPSRTVLDGIVGAVAALPGVTQVKAYENDTNATDSNGLPEHSIALVVLGGDSQQIGDTILPKKTPGAYTHGTTVVTVVGSGGINYSIRYFIPTFVPIKVAITVKTYPGYTTAIGEQIKASVAAYINALGIGKRVDLGRLYMPAQFFGAIGSETFEVNVLQISINPAAVASADVPIAFNEMATSLVANIALTAAP
jgi:uncharacterized phage protein gp47/JayE